MALSLNPITKLFGSKNDRELGRLVATGGSNQQHGVRDEFPE